MRSPLFDYIVSPHGTNLKNTKERLGLNIGRSAHSIYDPLLFGKDNSECKLPAASDLDTFGPRARRKAGWSLDSPESMHVHLDLGEGEGSCSPHPRSRRATKKS